MEIAGKFNLSTKEAIFVLGSKRLFERLRAVKWIVPLEENSRDLLWPHAELAKVQTRMCAGELPPKFSTPIPAT